MSGTEDTIIEFLKDKANAAWKDQKPYLLSFAGPSMVEAQIDYQAILNGERLKAFVERTAGEGRYHVVKHPHQRAKVGIVPSGIQFEFEDAVHEEVASAPRPVHGESVQGAALLSFLGALSALPAKDLDGVVIPTRVLVRLAKKR
ncbi:hypothetical protein [Granulicella sp. S156]|uniref:hypothetical protein n=1 Tax=Granulicella sp. S156 TaxID=1747224 RepID=UPI00131A95B1|nr:hypothetical protein [Granulicella sp. S156]